MPVLRHPPPPPPSLPIEIITLILESLDDSLWSRKSQRWVPCDSGERRNTLARCCRVSRSFGQLARAVLYRTISLHDYEELSASFVIDVERLARQLEIRSHLGLLVRELSLSLHISQENSLSTIIERCTFMTSLDLNLCGSSSVEPIRILNTITTSGLAALTSLKLNLPPAWSGPELAIGNLLRSQHGLRDLELAGCRLVMVPTDPPPTFRLRALTLDGIIDTSYLPFLTTYSHESLRSLSLDFGWDRDPTDPSLRYDLAPFTNLSSLSLSGKISNPIAHSLFTTISTLNLRTISFDFLYSANLSILPFLPPTLETLSIDGLDQLDLIATWIESGACPSLVRISWDRTEPVEGRDYEALQRACKTRGWGLNEVEAIERDPEDDDDDDLHYTMVSSFDEDSSEEDDKEERNREVEPTRSGSLRKYL